MTTYTTPIYECPNPCCGDFPGHTAEFDSAENMLCPFCGCSDDVHFLEQRPAKFVTIAAYDIYRAYGGPEEGGWYYDMGTVYPETIRAFEAGDFPQIADYKELLNRRFQGSCLVRTYVEQMAEARFPERRPHYC